MLCRKVRPTRLYLVVVALSLVLFLPVCILSRGSVFDASKLFDSKAWIAGWKKGHEYRDLRSLRVAVVEQTSYHDEVVGGVLSVLSDLEVDFTLYRSQFFAGFKLIMSALCPRTPESIQALEEALKADEVDAVVLVTCDSQFWTSNPSFFTNLYASSAHAICIPHEIEHFGTQADKNTIAPLVDGGRLTFMPLARHASERVHERLKEWATSDSLEGEPGSATKWDEVQVIDWVPTFPLPESSRVAKRPKEGNAPSNVAILGRMIPWARRYGEIMKELLDAILADPQLWGYTIYEPPSFGDPNTARLLQNSSSAFHLHLIGKPDMSPLDIPPPLLGQKGNHGEERVEDAGAVVQVHEDTEYVDFYNTIADMDIILPAFRGRLYLDKRASAGIPAAIIGRTPILADQDTLEAYPYISHPAYIRQSTNISEIDTIRLLRQAPSSSQRLEHKPSWLRNWWSEYEMEVRRGNVGRWAEVLEEIQRR